MLFDSRTVVRQIADLQIEAVRRWHHQELDNPYTGLLAVVCRQHQYNYSLWHEEDVARSPHVSDAKIAGVKRAIDGYNQQRNDWIERIDETLLQMLTVGGILPKAEAVLNTETPGSAMDRSSIMALRIYHFEEQLERDDVDAEHVAMVREKLRRCCQQREDLTESLGDLLHDIFTGRKLLKVYRQMKMYNDPTLNPYLYQPQKLAG
jgi:hypothetical protein